MPKKILLIENDSAFARGVSDRLESSGFEVRVTGDGKEGLDLAREWGPDAVVLCVELPGMSGYLVCQKLKKDDALKALPLVLTSAEATEETFEKHRTLKARADEYLLKPYTAAALVEKLGALGLPAGASGDGAEEELVSLEEELGLEASAEGSPDQELDGLGLDALGDEPVAAAGPVSMDDDLRLLDDAFDGLAATPADDADAALDELTGERAVGGDDVDAAAASLPDEDERAARSDFASLDRDAEAALGALGGADEALTLDEPPPAPARPPRGPSADLLRAAGIRMLDDEPPPAPAGGDRAGGAGDRASAELRGELERVRRELAARDAELAELTSRNRELARRAEDAAGELDGARAQARKAEGEARRAGDQAKAAESDLADLRRRLADADRRLEEAERDARRSREEAAAAAGAVARADALEREADELRTELLVARSEAEGARGEVERRTAELKKRVAELEATSAKNEERVVKAYQKIKADEKVREKVRKAIAIAGQLLDDGLPSSDAGPEKDRRAAGGSPLSGRE